MVTSRICEFVRKAPPSPPPARNGLRFVKHSVPAALRYSRFLSVARRNADRSHQPRSPPASNLPAPCCTPCQKQRKLRTTRDARLRHAQTTPPSSVYRRTPQPGIPPPFVASPLCKVSYTVLGNPASPPPSLHRAMMRNHPTPCAFEVSRSLSGSLEAPHRSSGRPGVHRKMGIPRGALLPFGILPLGLPALCCFTQGVHFFSRKNGFFFLPIYLP